MQPVRLESGVLGYRLRDAGDVEVSPLISDPEPAADLADTYPLELDRAERRVQDEWLLRAAQASGFGVTEVVRRTRPLPDHLVVAKSAFPNRVEPDPARTVVDLPGLWLPCRTA